MTEKQMMSPLAYRLEYWRRLVIPNVYFGWCETDMFIIQKSGYYWEIEIKCSVSDWKADFKKTDRWYGKNYIGYAKEFYFAIPSELIAGGIPDFVPEEVGLIVVRSDSYGNLHAYFDRNSSLKNSLAEKLSPKTIVELCQKANQRYWNLILHSPQKELGFDGIDTLQ